MEKALSALVEKLKLNIVWTALKLRKVKNSMLFWKVQSSLKSISNISVSIFPHITVILGTDMRSSETYIEFKRQYTGLQHIESGP